MESLKILSYARSLKIYKSSFNRFFGYNLESFLSATEGFNISLFCSAIDFREDPHAFESFIIRNYGTQALVILRAVNCLPPRKCFSIERVTIHRKIIGDR